MTSSNDKRIIFVSTMGGNPWGGSEELWSRTALDLVSQGFPVSASVHEWSPLHPRVVELRDRGVDLRPRPAHYDWRANPWRRLESRRKGVVATAVEHFIAARPARMIVFSDGGALPPLQLLEFCVASGLPFVTIGQANWEGAWHADGFAARYRAALARALRCFFVSHANRRLTEKQIGGEISNAEVVWNPVNLSPQAAPPAWPPLDGEGTLRLACVGRLHPPSKGQDLLFEALAGPEWKSCPWRLCLYGEGPMRQGLERLSQVLGISGRVTFAGFALVKDIWAANHVLLMPSRYEGLPLTMVEAMFCARPIVATDVAGHAEIVEDGVTGFLAEAPTARAMAAAMERFWARRHEAEEIGKAGARKIRQLVPPDPGRIFAEKLKSLAGLGATG